MNADELKKAVEIVTALRSYASDCDDDEACCQCTFAWVCDKCGGNAPKIIADLIDSLTAQLADYHHMSKLVDGKMAENQRLRRSNEKLQSQLTESQRRGKAAAEIVRCAECEHFEEKEGYFPRCRIRDKADYRPHKNDFCSYAVKRGPQEAKKGAVNEPTR